MSVAAIVDACRWGEPGGRDAAARILSFLDEIGVPVALRGDEPGLLPGLSFAGGTLLIDPAIEVWPGDLLHEAGHYAVFDPQRRAALSDPGSDPGEEMAALAWSAAAALAHGIPLEVVFHEHGYKGDGPWLATQFATGDGPGVPMLAWYGLTTEPRCASPERPGYPAMQRWIR